MTIIKIYNLIEIYQLSKIKINLVVLKGGNVF